LSSTPLSAWKQATWALDAQLASGTVQVGDGVGGIAATCAWQVQRGLVRQSSFAWQVNAITRSSASSSMRTLLDDSAGGMRSPGSWQDLTPVERTGLSVDPACPLADEAFLPQRLLMTPAGAAVPIAQLAHLERDQLWGARVVEPWVAQRAGPLWYTGAAPTQLPLDGFAPGPWKPVAATSSTTWAPGPTPQGVYYAGPR